MWPSMAQLLWVLPLLRLRAVDYLATLVRPLIVASLMIGAVSWTCLMLLETPIILRMVLLIGLGATCYGVGMGLFRKFTRELVGYLRHGSVE